MLNGLRGRYRRSRVGTWLEERVPTKRKWTLGVSVAVTGLVVAVSAGAVRYESDRQAEADREAFERCVTSVQSRLDLLDVLHAIEGALTGIVLVVEEAGVDPRIVSGLREQVATIGPLIASYQPGSLTRCIEP